MDWTIDQGKSRHATPNVFTDYRCCIHTSDVPHDILVDESHRDYSLVRVGGGRGYLVPLGGQGVFHLVKPPWLNVNPVLVPGGLEHRPEALHLPNTRASEHSTRKIRVQSILRSSARTLQAHP